MRHVVPLFVWGLAFSAPALAAETVPVPAFRSLELRGGGEVMLTRGPAQRVTVIEGSTQFTRFRVARDGKLQIDVCNERCPRNYRLRVQIESPAAPDVAIMGGGAIRASGFGPQSHISAAVMGGGQIDVRSVEAGTVSAAVHGGGQILARSRRTLSAAVNGGGEVRYWGNPSNVSQSIHGGGSIRPGG